MRRLRHRITLQRLVSARGDMGNPVEQWEDVATNVPARVLDISGREYREGQKEEAEVTATVQIRFRAVDAGMRVLFAGKVYDIVAALDHDGRGRWLELQCKVVS